LTPSARSGSLIAGDGTKNGLSRSEQKTVSTTQNNRLTGKAPYKSGANLTSTILAWLVVAAPAMRSSNPSAHCPSINFCEPHLSDQFNNSRIYRSLRLLATLPRITDSEGE
jgi:hypothetical protein